MRRGTSRTLAALALALVVVSLAACGSADRSSGMNESAGGVVLQVTATDGQVTSFWLDAGAAGRMVANGRMLVPARVAVLAYPGCWRLFEDAWHGDRVRIRETGAITLEAAATAPDAQLPMTSRCS